MFQKFLGVYTLHSQSFSISDSAFSPIYIQSMFESESATLEHTKNGEEHFLLLAYTNASLVWTIIPGLPKIGSPSQVRLPLCANASNKEIPPTKGWYTGNIFVGWKHEINIEVFPKGGKHKNKKNHEVMNSLFSVDCVWGKWKSSECSKEGKRELRRDVEIPETLFGEKCPGPDHKTETCEMSKGKCKSFVVSLRNYLDG